MIVGLSDGAATPSSMLPSGTEVGLVFAQRKTAMSIGARTPGWVADTGTEVIMASQKV